ncbi:helix-turn-helix transcriptional regulator [Staphylococcus nepalensis]|uniref:helix-turn-helix domain-containing protein n=1 Tax=Staphylococcus nepalensis TaxID=214473 RepID=UPI003017EEAA
MNNNTNLGQRIRQLRMRNKLSMEELADKLNELYPNEDGTKPFGKGKISKWEAGKVDPAFSKVAKVSEFFNVSIDYLSGYEDRQRFPVIEIPVYSDYNITKSTMSHEYKYISNNLFYSNDNLFYLNKDDTTYLIDKDLELKNGNTALCLIKNNKNIDIYKANIYSSNILLTTEDGKQDLYKFDEIEVIGVIVSKEINMI